MVDRVPENILEQIRNIKGTQAILFTGSRAIGKTNRHSDWDFYVMLKNGERRWRKTWKYEDTWIEIFCNDRKQIIQEFKEDLDEGRGITTHMFAHGIIIQDTKYGLLKALAGIAKKNWKSGPKKMTAKEKAWIAYDLSSYVQDIEDCLGSNNRAELLLNQALNECVRYYYRLAGIWLPRPKERLLDLAKRNKAISRVVESAINAASWKRKAALIIQLCRKIADENRLSLNGELYRPPEAK